MKHPFAHPTTTQENRYHGSKTRLRSNLGQRFGIIPQYLGTSTILLVLATAATNASAQTVTVDFSTQLGTPTYRATGFIYGLSEDATQPPTHFVSDIKNQYYRVGGAQLGCPNGGWVNNTANYTRRFNTVKAYYSVAKNVGGKVILLVHDLWGADLVCPVNEYPGDNNNWTRFDTFINQVISDAKASGMTGPDVHWDIWNEPDCCGFFGDRPQSQYLATWKRGFQAIRAALPNAIIVGPSSNIQPGTPWFTAFLDYIKTNNVVPDYLSWHQLNRSDIWDSKNAADTGLASRGLTVKGYQCNEYGDLNLKEQTSGMSAWFIGRMERLNIDGARANWGMYGGLWDTMGDLVANKGSGYQPAGAWWVYQRYAQMTGTRIAVTTTDRSVDGTGSKDSAKGSAMVLLGRRHTTGNATINLTNLNQAAYLVANNQIKALVERIPEGNPVLAPTKVSETNINVSNNQAAVTWNWTGPDDAYVITVTGSASTGTGGTSAAGGTTSVGGTTSIGGTSSRGGTSSIGGTSSRGGTSSIGGTSSRGGTSSTGGAAQTGGKSSSGGTSTVPVGGSSTVGSGGLPATGGALGNTGGVASTGGNTLGVGGNFATGGAPTVSTVTVVNGTTALGGALGQGQGGAATNVVGGATGTGTLGTGGDDGSCSCSVVGAKRSPWSAFFAALGLTAMVRRRKRLSAR